MAGIRSVKVVIVGDVGVGKTSLYFTYTHDAFPDSPLPSVWDNYAANTRVGKETYYVSLWDTQTQADYDRLRPFSCPQTDVFVVYFSVGLPASLKNIRDKWLPEVSHHSPGTPWTLVATQIDLRADPGPQVVPEKTDTDGRREPLVRTAQGEGMARELGAAEYLECSAKMNHGVKNVFEQTIIAAVTEKTRERREPRKKASKCIVL